jgi:hypothetical protein
LIGEWHFYSKTQNIIEQKKICFSFGFVLFFSYLCKQQQLAYNKAVPKGKRGRLGFQRSVKHFAAPHAILCSGRCNTFQRPLNSSGVRGNSPLPPGKHPLSPGLPPSPRRHPFHIPFIMLRVLPCFVLSFPAILCKIPRDLYVFFPRFFAQIAGDLYTNRGENRYGLRANKQK